MNIRTNLIEEYVNFVDNAKKQNKKLWIFTIILVFILLIITFRNKINYSKNCNYMILLFYMNTPSLNEINKNSAMDPNMLTIYYEMKLMNDFKNIKYQNPKMTQLEISSQLNMSPSTIQRYRNDINMNSPYRINQNNVKKRQKKVEIDENVDRKRGSIDLDRLQLTSNDRKNKIKKSFKSWICKRRGY